MAEAKVETQEREPFHWQSAISYKTRERIVVRGYDVNELMGNLTMAEMFHLVWKGDLPPANVAKMLDALFVCFAEHAMSPSSASARMVMSGAGYIIPALAGGILSIGYTHVDAHEAAQAWINGVKLAKDRNWTLDQAADYLAAGVRNKEKSDEFVRMFGERNVLPGWHHPQHIRDLRSPRVIELAEKYGIAGDHIKFIQALENATEKYWGRRLYSNVAGAISASLVDMGFRPDECLAFCAIARSVSVVAHCMEEKTREKGWRASTNSKITQPLDLALQKPDYYDGPADRHLPAEKITAPMTRAPYHYIEPAKK
jgi:citrate synthase